VNDIPDTELYVHVYYDPANAVRVTHLPTGLNEFSSQYGSILRNKREAVRRLTKKLERKR
jgi:protein subunit release factor A